MSRAQERKKTLGARIGLPRSKVATDAKLVSFWTGNAIDAGDSGGQTALHFAVRSNDFTLAAFLVHHGANVNAVSKDAKTPLMMAALQENVILVHFLLHNGALAALPRIGQSNVAMDGNDVPKFLDWLQKQKSPHVTPRQKVEEALRNSWRPQK